MNTKNAVAVLVSIFLVACGGGGGTSGSTTPAYSTFEMTGREVPWTASYLANTDGSENLILASMDEANPFNITPPTPIYVLKGETDGSVSNITNTFFNKIPSYYWVRNITTFIHPVTGTQAVWFCNTGREGPQKSSADAPIPRINGQWGEQDGLYVMENGKFVDRTDTLPQVVDFSHGCASFKNSQGSTSLVKNTLGWLGPDETQRSILSYVNGKWAPAMSSSWNQPGVFEQGFNSFFAATGNFQKSTTGENVVFGTTLLQSSGSSYSIANKLKAPDLESQGYTQVQGAISGDVNNDGWDDLILVLSADGVILKPFLSGSKLALFRNDGKGNLVYEPTAFIDYYGDSEFGLDIKIMDINFDGHPDIVTSGQRYLYGTNLHDLKTDKVFINNGSGKFNLKSIDGTKLNSKCGSTCQIATWFLKGKDSNSYTLMTYSKSGDVRKFYSQNVTIQDKLTFK